jgi:hypothetical protein
MLLCRRKHTSAGIGLFHVRCGVQEVVKTALHISASLFFINLLPILSKILEKLLLKRIYRDTNLQEWVPSHQFGLRKAHSTIQQRHRITDIINKAFEEHKYCSAVFLNVSQAFDKVWHQGLLYKIKQTLPSGYLNILQSCLSDRYFSVSLNNKTSSLLPCIHPPLAFKEHVPDYFVICGLYVSAKFLYTISHKRHDFKKCNKR